MSDSFEDQMEFRQNLIVQKMAEIGIVVQVPVQFAKIPGGPIGGQLAFVWDDDSHVQQAADDMDEFTKIMLAEKENEKAQREAAIKEAELQALEDLQKLAEGDLGLDDD